MHNRLGIRVQATQTEVHKMYSKFDNLLGRDLWAEKGITSSLQIDWGLHHQNSLKSVLEREGEILLYTKWRALYIHKVYCTCNRVG